VRRFRFLCRKFSRFPKTIYTDKFSPRVLLVTISPADNSIQFDRFDPHEVLGENPGLHEAGAAERRSPEAQ
jgi:hypothetical protein